MREALAERMCKGEKEKEEKANNVDRRGSGWFMPFGVVLLWVCLQPLEVAEEASSRGNGGEEKEPLNKCR